MKLGDVVAHSTSVIDPSNGTISRYVAGGHMDTDQLKISRWGEIGDGYLGPAFIRPFQVGDVLYGSRRTYLRKLAVADFDGVCANTTLVLRTSSPNKLIQEYLPFVTTSQAFHNFSIRESKGSVNPYVNWSDLAKFEFLLPPLQDQEKLAKLFWALEEYKNILELQLNNLSLTIQSFTAAWKANHLHEIKNLSEIVEMYQPKTIMKHELIANGKYEVHGANNLLGHYDKFNHSGKTIAIACRGATCGSVNVIIGDVWITGNAMVVAPKDLSDLDYFVELLPTIDFKRAISGSAQPQITRSSLETLTVPFPEPKLRLQFVEEMTLFREARLAINEELYSLEKLLATLKSELIETI